MRLRVARKVAQRINAGARYSERQRVRAVHRLSRCRRPVVVSGVTYKPGQITSPRRRAKLLDYGPSPLEEALRVWWWMGELGRLQSRYAWGGLPHEYPPSS